MKEALRDIPSFYMMKLSYGPAVTRAMEEAGIAPLQLEHPLEETLNAVAKALDKRVQDVVVMMLDRSGSMTWVPDRRRGQVHRALLQSRSKRSESA